MKPSRYNFFFDFPEEPEKIVAYNSRTGALALMEKNNYDKYKNYVEKGIPIDDSKLIEDLKKGQFLIDDNVDELQLLRFNLWRSRFNDKNLGLTIAPTLGCNFACVYCYEKDSQKNVFMSEEVQDKIVEYIKRQIKYLQSVNITWYGGEPLLAFDIVKDMSEKIIKLCDENEVMYGASIITNGYNLTREVVEQFKNLRLSFIQITLDGPQDVHDKRRPLKGGQGTFEKILINIEENIDIMPNIYLRINVDKENVTRVNKILDELEIRGLKNRLSVYLGHVEHTNDSYVPNKCLSMYEYSKVTYMFEKVLKERGFSNNLMHKYPHLKYNFCGADSVNSMVIDPEGYIYKCWSDIGMEEYRVGNILDDTSLVSLNVDKYMEYLLYDPTIDEMCIDCKLLPICMGGCPRRRIERVTERCRDYKYVLEEYLKDIAKELLEKKQERV